MAYRKSTIRVNNQWRNGSRGDENCWPGQLAKDNAAVNGSGTVTPYGKVYGGTVLAADSVGQLHPCGLAEIPALVSASVTVTVAPLTAPAFNVGDEVRVVEHRTTRAIAVTGAASTDVITSASVHNLRVGDKVRFADIVGGASVTWTGEFAIATVPSSTTFTLAGVNFTTDISAGSMTVQLPEPVIENITVTDRNVVSVDEDTGAIVLSGSTFSSAAGALLVKPAAYIPVGILNDTVRTVRHVDDEEVVEDREINLAVEGDARIDYVIGAGPKVRELLTAGVHIDPLTGAKYTPKFVGFTFREV